LGVSFISKTFTPETAWAGSGVKEIRANRFILEDDNGKTRAMLIVDKDGSALALYDENGKPGASLSLFKKGPMLELYAENGKSRAVLTMIEGWPGLTLHDEKGNRRVLLGMLKDGPGLLLNDENGKPRAKLGTGQATTPDGKVISYPESCLILSGADGKVIWSAP
jgi:hypothetical protein